MKNKVKIVLGLFSTFIFSLAISKSFSLYKTEPLAQIIDIFLGQPAIPTPTPITQQTGNRANVMNYQIKSVGADSAVLTKDTQIDNYFTVGGTNAVGSTYTQNIIVGDLSFTITLPNANYAKALVDGGSHIYLDINQGSGNGYFGEHAYFTVDPNNNKVIVASFSGIPVYLAGTSGTLTRKIAVGGVNQVTLANYELDIKNKVADEIIMSWKNLASYTYAYVVGNMEGSNWSIDVIKYQMVPNPKASSFEWMHEIEFNAGAQFKAKKGDDWSSGGNYAINAGSAGEGTVYWSGSTSSGVAWVKK